MTPDLFESTPAPAGEAARPAAATPLAACEPAREVDRTSIAYFAKLQGDYYAAAAKSAEAYHAKMAKARSEAQEGIDRAVAHAERDVPGWSDVAYEFIRLHAMQNRGKRFTGYEIVQAALAYGVPKPPTDKAFGGPLQRAARAQVLRKVGGVPDPNPERHGSMVPLWEAA